MITEILAIAGKINILRIPFFDNKEYLVKFQSPIGGVRSIYLDSLLPFEAAETSHALNFARKYDLPLTGVRVPEITIDGRKVIDYYQLDKLKMWLTRVKSAVNLWRLTGEKDINGTRHVIAGVDEYYSLCARWCHNGASNDDDESIMLTAKNILIAMVNEGLWEFPTTNQLTFENGKFINQIDPRSAMGYIWSLISDDLASGRNWHYKQCAYCDAWEDMSKPGLRRSCWSHCNKPECVKAHKRDKSKLRSKKYRQRRDVK
jgi:hypothetical protein